MGGSTKYGSLELYQFSFPKLLYKMSEELEQQNRKRVLKLLTKMMAETISVKSGRFLLHTRTENAQLIPDDSEGSSTCSTY